MWMSNIFIIVDRNNADRNSIRDIADAVTGMGSVMGVDEQSHWIEAAVPAHEVPTVKAIDGVAYVRCVFNYFCGNPPRRAA